MNAVRLDWVENPPPPRGRGVGGEIDHVIEELKKRPGKWAKVQEGIASTSGAAKWRKRGCEAYSHRPDTTSNKCDVYARWPESLPEEPEPQEQAPKRTQKEVAEAYAAQHGHSPRTPEPAPTPGSVKAQLASRLGHKRPVAR